MQNHNSTQTISEIVSTNVQSWRTSAGWSRPELARRVNALLPIGHKRWSAHTLLDIEGTRGRIRALDPSEIAALARAFRSTVPLLMSPSDDALVEMGDERLTRDTYAWTVLGLTPSETNRYNFSREDYGRVNRILGSIAEQLALVSQRADVPVTADVEEVNEFLLRKISGDSSLLQRSIDESPELRSAIAALVRSYARLLATESEIGN